MKKSFKHSHLVIIIALTIPFSCVSPRVVEDMKLKNERCAVDNATLKSENENLTIANNEMTSQIDDLKKRMKAMARDTMILGTSLEKMSVNYARINDLYEILLDKNKELLAGSVSESGKLMSKLQMTEEDLQKREDELKSLERILEKKKGNLEELKTELQKREEKVRELEKIISEKDAAVTDLKNKVADALYSFRNKGITVEEKNGRVNVSLEAQLLFATGSTKVDEKGKSALKKLAKVLEEQTDIDILVEGHTDTDKYKGGGTIKDNWELSVLRATSVVRILTSSSKIDPQRITAAGRGEYMPIDPADTKPAKEKNRRIEVILIPNLDELFELLEKD